MADQFRIIPPQVRAEGKDVPPEQIQAAINALAQQMTIALNALVGEPEPPSGPAGGDLSGTYPNPTVSKVNGVTAGSMANQNANAVAITGGTLSGVAITGSTLSTSSPIGVPSGGTGQNALSAHNVLLGEGTSAVGFAAPGANGTIFSSTGTGVDPSFQTAGALGLGVTANPLSQFAATTSAQLAGIISDETGSGSLVFGTAPALSGANISGGGGINGVPIGGTTPSTGSFTNLSASGTLTGIAGRLLNVQVFTSSGTYTPTTGTTKVIVEVQAPGGGGGGSPATGASQSAGGGGGGGGAYAKVLVTSGFSGASITIGAAGAGGAAGANAGTTGGTTLFGTFVSCPGGLGGSQGTAVGTPAFQLNAGQASAAPTISGATTLVSSAGSSSIAGYVLVAGSASISGQGGSSIYGGGGLGLNAASSIGRAGTGFGAGGGGGANQGASQPAVAGGNASGGVVIAWEYS